jgi:hypothetical protein
MFDIVKEIRFFYATYEANVYPNAIILSKQQFSELFPFIPDYSIDTVFGLKILLTDSINKPRLLKL